ncbi:hypothetical protein ACXZ1K_10330 [Pedobacter sp. PWIIR3]
MKNIILQTKIAKYMRGLGLFGCFLALNLLLAGCSKINDSTHMDITLSPPTVAFNISINSSLTTGNSIAEITTAINLDSLIKLQAPRFSSANITSMKITSFSLSLVDTVRTENNFANVENVAVSIQGNGQTSNTVAAISNTDTMSGLLAIPVTATDNDLKAFLNTGQVKYLLIGKLRKATTKVLRAKASATYRVQLSL